VCICRVYANDAAALTQVSLADSRQSLQKDLRVLQKALERVRAPVVSTNWTNSLTRMFVMSITCCLCIQIRHHIDLARVQHIRSEGLVVNLGFVDAKEDAVILSRHAQRFMV
jgi:hypothetical protein